MFQCTDLTTYSKSTQPENKPHVSTVSSNMINLECPKCGTTKRSGLISCCARGGTWFENCGNAGSTKFNHTWVEGIQACKSEFLRDLVLSPLWCWIRLVEILLVLRSENKSIGHDCPWHSLSCGYY